MIEAGLVCIFTLIIALFWTAFNRNEKVVLLNILFCGAAAVITTGFEHALLLASCIALFIGTAFQDELWEWANGHRTIICVLLGSLLTVTSFIGFGKLDFGIEGVIMSAGGIAFFVLASRTYPPPVEEAA